MKLDFPALFIATFCATSFFLGFPCMAQISTPNLEPTGGGASPDIPSNRASNEDNPSLIQQTPSDSRNSYHPETSVKAVGPYVTPIEYR